MSPRIATLIATTAVAIALSVPTLAQNNAQAQQTTLEKIKSMTKAEWAKLVTEWNKNKAKYNTCRIKAKNEGLKGQQRWASIYDCMVQ